MPDRFELVSVSEIARRLGISRQKADRLAGKGEFGGRIFGSYDWKFIYQKVIAAQEPAVDRTFVNNKVAEIMRDTV